MNVTDRFDYEDIVVFAMRGVQLFGLALLCVGFSLALPWLIYGALGIICAEAAVRVFDRWTRPQISVLSFRQRKCRTKSCKNKICNHNPSGYCQKCWALRKVELMNIARRKEAPRRRHRDACMQNFLKKARVLVEIAKDVVLTLFVPVIIFALAFWMIVLAVLGVCPFKND